MASINEVAIRWGSTVPLPANTAVIQLSLLASYGSQAYHIPATENKIVELKYLTCLLSCSIQFPRS